MQFGFHLVSDQAKSKIRHNLDQVNRLTTSGVKLMRLLQTIGQVDLPDQTVQLIGSLNQGQFPVIMRAILYQDCTYYYKIYRKLYDHLNLASFDEDETVYELEL